MKNKLAFLKEKFEFTKSPLVIDDGQAFGDFLMFAIGNSDAATLLQVEFKKVHPELCANLETFLPAYADWLIVNHWGEEDSEVAA